MGGSESCSLRGTNRERLVKEQLGRRHSGDVEEPEERSPTMFGQKVSNRTSNRDSTVQRLAKL